MDSRALSRGLDALARHTWCPHTPTPKQREFLGIAELEALYGGAAGGGKSDALLMAALEHVDTAGYSAILFRRTFADLNLEGAVMARSHEWLRGTAAAWNGNDKRWRFPSGAALSFGYLDVEADKYRYQSAEFQFVGFDELTQFQESQYTYLLSRLRRRAGVEIPLRARAATNPGGVGHDWVMSRFLTGKRPFVSAKMLDNPHLDVIEYRRSLAELDNVTRQQLEDGMWVKDATGLVYKPLETTWLKSAAPACDFYVLGLDFGVVDENALSVIGWAKHSRVAYALECYRFKGSPTSMAEEVRRLMKSYSFDQIVGDVGGIGKAFVEEARDRFGIPIDAAEKQNKLGYIRLLNGALERGELVVARATSEDLYSEWSSLMRLPDGREAPSQPNHASDATLYAWRAALAFLEAAKPKMKTREQVIEAEAERLKRIMSGMEDE